jgi:hypothetical protein
MGYKTYSIDESFDIDRALLNIFMNDYIEWRKEIKKYTESWSSWSLFINNKNLGIHVKAAGIECPEYWIITVTDSKVLLLTQLKYGLTFRNLDEKE